MRLVQYRGSDGRRGVAAVDDKRAALQLHEVETVYELALEAIETGTTLLELAGERRSRNAVDLDAAEKEGRLLPPLEHPVPTRCWITGTGVTHPRVWKIPRDDEPMDDTAKLLMWGMEQGKPDDGGPGVQPEWFFKGNGSTLIGSGQPLAIPDFAVDCGEEPELVGHYVIADDGTPCRLGWALGNEVTDHAMQKQNIRYYGHSKLRASAVGPELLLGDLPSEIKGTTRILRGKKVLWKKGFETGEANMTHHLSGIEHHHFKYPMFRRPGDVHLHFFGTATSSHRFGVTVEPGDTFETSSALFGRPLRNTLERITWAAPVVRTL